MWLVAIVLDTAGIDPEKNCCSANIFKCLGPYETLNLGLRAAKVGLVN